MTNKQFLKQAALISLKNKSLSKSAMHKSAFGIPGLGKLISALKGAGKAVGTRAGNVGKILKNYPYTLGGVGGTLAGAGVGGYTGYSQSKKNGDGALSSILNTLIGTASGGVLGNMGGTMLASLSRGTPVLKALTEGWTAPSAMYNNSGILKRDVKNLLSGLYGAVKG